MNTSSYVFVVNLTSTMIKTLNNQFIIYTCANEQFDKTRTVN